MYIRRYEWRSRWAALSHDIKPEKKGGRTGKKLTERVATAENRDEPKNKKKGGRTGTKRSRETEKLRRKSSACTDKAVHSTCSKRHVQHFVPSSCRVCVCFTSSVTVVVVQVFSACVLLLFFFVHPRACLFFVLGPHCRGSRSSSNLPTSQNASVASFFRSFSSPPTTPAQHTQKADTANRPLPTLFVGHRYTTH